MHSGARCRVAGSAVYAASHCHRHRVPDSQLRQRSAFLTPPQRLHAPQCRPAPAPSQPTCPSAPRSSWRCSSTLLSRSSWGARRQACCPAGRGGEEREGEGRGAEALGHPVLVAVALILWQLADTRPCAPTAILSSWTAGDPENHDPHPAGRHGRDQPQGRPHGGLPHLVRLAMLCMLCCAVICCAGRRAGYAVHAVLQPAQHSSCPLPFCHLCATCASPRRFAYRSIFSTVNLAMEVRHAETCRLQANK